MDVTGDPRREAWIVGIGVVVLAILARYAWLPNAWEFALQQAADTWGLPVTDVGRWFSAWALGDGQAFAVIAADPLGLEIGDRLGYPAYRYGRAGFGWLAWAASLGRAEWVPYGLAIVGSLAVVATLVLAVRLRPSLGPKAWLIILNPAVFIAFAGDTAETLGIFALALAISSGYWWASAAVGVIRESYIVALVGRWRSMVWGLASALLLAVLWALRFGFESGQYGGNLGLPLIGYFEAPSLQAAVLAVVAATTLAVGLRFRDWGWVASGLFVLCFTHWVVESPVNGWRAAGLLFVIWAFGPGYVAPERASSKRSAVPSLSG
jgi:hypothetical protein